jgi:hypothetical protein
MLSIGFVVTPGFPVMSLAALSVFEFANFGAEKTLYDIHVLSEDALSLCPRSRAIPTGPAPKCDRRTAGPRRVSPAH